MCIKVLYFVPVSFFISSIVVVLAITTHHSCNYTNIEHLLYVRKVLRGNDTTIKKKKRDKIPAFLEFNKCKHRAVINARKEGYGLLIAGA